MEELDAFFATLTKMAFNACINCDECILNIQSEEEGVYAAVEEEWRLAVEQIRDDVASIPKWKTSNNNLVPLQKILADIQIFPNEEIHRSLSDEYPIEDALELCPFSKLLQEHLMISESELP